MNAPLRVLIVEDSIADAELELAELRRGGYEPVCERVDTPEVMKEALKKPWDIIISDYVMPRFSGPAALRMVQEMGIDLPFIIVTGQVGEETAVEAMRAGASDYVLKGNLARLVPAIQRELRDAEVRRERKRADEALHRAHEDLRLAHVELERRVKERTRELATERERLAITLRSIGDGVIATDTQGNVTLMNEVAEELSGWTEDEATGGPLANVFHIINEESRVPFENPVARVLKTGAIVGLANNTVLVARDGTERIIADSAAPVRGEDRNTVGVVLVFRDVTERKHAERALLRAKEYAEKLIQTANVMVIGLDATGAISVFNEAAEIVTGYKKDDLVGKNWFEVLVPKDRYPKVWEMFTAAIAGGTLPVTFENPILTKGGEERYVVWRNSKIEDDGKTAGTISFGMDITERKRAEEERERLLREVEARASELAFERDRWRILVESISDAVFVCDAKGNITLANEAGLALIGVDRADAVGTLADYLDVLQLRAPDGQPVPLKDLAITRALNGEVTRWREELATHPTTQRSLGLSVSAAPLRDETGRIVGAISTLRDVTERVEYDRLKDEFISVAAHELKTPVAIMKAHAQALLRTVADIPAPRRKMLEAINRGSDRIDRIVGDLLDISRLLAGQLELSIESIDLPQMVEDVVDRMALTTAKHHIKVVRMEPAVVRGDRDRLEQVLINLIDNAIKYSPKGGVVELSVEVSDHEAVVSVKDWGVGIPKEKKEHIFERFYRAHTNTPYDYGGMGVGLFISREIITRYGGRMWFESEEGRGSTFYFSLPFGG